MCSSVSSTRSLHPAVLHGGSIPLPLLSGPAFKDKEKHGIRCIFSQTVFWGENLHPYELEVKHYHEPK